MIGPRYPIYIVSKGRPGNLSLTARFLADDRVPFKVVIEPQEFAEYAKTIDESQILVLPFSNLGQGSAPARNWIWEHAKSAGFKRHWILDDNIRRIYRRWRGVRIPCEAGPAFAAVEDLVDRYENVPVAGMNYKMFVPDRQNHPSFSKNVHVYSCVLIENAAPYRWRGPYNEDVDLSLQVVTSGKCTILTNAFLVDKMRTMTMKGGNEELYKADGRLRATSFICRRWPKVVKLDRRFGRPHHVINWKAFHRNALVRVADTPSATTTAEYGLSLKAVKEPKSELTKRLLETASTPGKGDSDA